MSKPTIEIIIAVDKAGGFAKDGNIPWKCKEDMKRFANISKDIGVCVMGKNTYTDMLEMRGDDEETKQKIINKGILPGRECYVVTSTMKQEDVIGATVVSGIQAVLNIYLEKDQRIAVIGGEKLYIQALASCTKIHATIMDGLYGCDRFFPVDKIPAKFDISPDGSIALQTDVDGETKTVWFVNYTRKK